MLLFKRCDDLNILIIVAKCNPSSSIKDLNEACFALSPTLGRRWWLLVTAAIAGRFPVIFDRYLPVCVLVHAATAAAPCNEQGDRHNSRYGNGGYYQRYEPISKQRSVCGSGDH